MQIILYQKQILPLLFLKYTIFTDFASIKIKQFFPD